MILSLLLLSSVVMACGTSMPFRVAKLWPEFACRCFMYSSFCTIKFRRPSIMEWHFSMLLGGGPASGADSEMPMRLRWLLVGNSPDLNGDFWLFDDFGEDWIEKLF